MFFLYINLYHSHSWPSTDIEPGWTDYHDWKHPCQHGPWRHGEDMRGCEAMTVTYGGPGLNCSCDICSTTMMESPDQKRWCGSACTWCPQKICDCSPIAVYKENKYLEFMSLTHSHPRANVWRWVSLLGQWPIFWASNVESGYLDQESILSFVHLL